MVNKYLRKQEDKRRNCCKYSHRVWGIEERIFKEDFGKRLFMFDVLVASVLMYRMGIYVQKEQAKLEAVQIKYIKWCLGLNRCMPGYIVLDETKVDKLRLKTGEKVLKYE